MNTFVHFELIPGENSHKFYGISTISESFLHEIWGMAYITCHIEVLAMRICG